MLSILQKKKAKISSVETESILPTSTKTSIDSTNNATTFSKDAIDYIDTLADISDISLETNETVITNVANAAVNVKDNSNHIEETYHELQTMQSSLESTIQELNNLTQSAWLWWVLCSKLCAKGLKE